MRRYVLAAVFLVFAAVVHAPAAEHPWNNRRIYYIIEFQGKLREKGYFVRQAGSYQRQPCIIVEEEKFSYSADNNQVPLFRTTSKTITTPDGIALQRTEQRSGSETGRQTITIRGGEADFVASGYYGSSSTVPVPPGVMFEITGDWLAAQAPQTGKVFSALILDRTRRTVNQETVRVLEQVETRAPEVWLAEFSADNRSTLSARFTADGRLTRLEARGLVYQVVSRDEFEKGKIQASADPLPAVAGYSQPERDYPNTSVIPIGETIPAWDNFAWLVMHASPAHRWQTMLSTSEYSQIDPLGFELAITALRDAPRVDAAATLPMPVPPEVAIFLASTGALPAGSPAIIEAARSAISDSETRREETNVVRAVSYLAGWINQNIVLDDWYGYSSSPEDALANRRGDSLGHARLFSAMARAIGIPSRLCQGFLAYTGRAVHHCWSEVWINGTWIPVDTTVSRVGLPAGYVLAERADPDGTYRTNFSLFMKEPGLSITLVSAGRETPSGRLAELAVGERRTYAFSENDWMANLYWGFAMRLPPAWSGSAKLNSVEMTSPDRQASIKCEALAGDFGATKNELDANVETLRANLQRFRLIESRVVAFDADGSTQALFMDFTCVQEGITLRCRQYVLPRRQRAFRLSFWAPADMFSNYTPDFDSTLASFEY